MRIEVFPPDGELDVRDEGVVVPVMAPPRGSGMRIAVLENRKPNAHVLLTGIASGLAARLGAPAPLVLHKENASAPCPSSTIEQVVGAADLVLTGSAD